MFGTPLLESTPKRIEERDVSLFFHGGEEHSPEIGFDGKEELQRGICDGEEAAEKDKTIEFHPFSEYQMGIKNGQADG